MFPRYYMKPGKGVEKRPDDEPRLRIFFELLFRKLWNLCKVNILYLLMSVPAILAVFFLAGFVSSPITERFAPVLANLMDLSAADVANPTYATGIVMIDASIRMFLALVFLVFLGSGPATAGVTYILRNYAREEHSWVFSDFWQHMKANFKQSVAVFALDIFFVIVIGIAIDFYTKEGGILFLGGILAAFAGLVYLMMHLYIYPSMVTFELPLKNLFKNSLIFALSYGPKNLLLLLILALVHIGIPYAIIVLNAVEKYMIFYIMFELIFLIAASGFMTNFFVYPTIEKYIEMAKGNDTNQTDI